MGWKRLDTISDYARHGIDLRATCEQCGRAVVIASLALSLEMQRRNLPRDLDAVRRVLRCEGCGSKRPHLVPVMRE
ncbi:hypothetical protein [Novosphingobium huizhouense]|uniref:hypothetical protein n=1 Tax=Novosphingobium huizhouense TaxID=2866625 RepID=UPI001CD8B30E|nr:hypothetical protein [Novosphingobium huizhouense]